MKTKTECLHEYGINPTNIKAEFNDAMFAAMEEYASQQTAALQARVVELERENEKLMELLEDEIKSGAFFPKEEWQSYCREHNLKPTDK